MILTRLLLFSALFQINHSARRQQQQQQQDGDEQTKLKLRKKDFLKLLQFADVPDFDVEFIYEETFSPDGIANQLIQNFFNWFCPTVFWFSYLPFYNRISPVFDPANNLRLFGDIPIFNVTEIYQVTNEAVIIRASYLPSFGSLITAFDQVQSVYYIDIELV